MVFFAQAQVAEVVEQAAHEAGWVAALFALIVLSGFTLLGWFVRQLWNDLRDVQEYIRTTLTTLVSNSNECLGDVRQEIKAFRATVEKAPCGTEMRRVIEKYWEDQAAKSGGEGSD